MKRLLYSLADSHETCIAWGTSSHCLPPHEEVARSEVLDVVNALPAQLYEALLVKAGIHPNGHSYRTLAKQRGCSHEKIRNDAHRALELVRRRFGDNG